ncbi:serpentine type 7TM GPCR chemoreceptor srd domain-containing protein [Ditylenchus destructor]|nr:serpentine type 7TM GPCR chemoreceptor srd domain-containing protein [Ditylenchus destructor]
MALAYQLTESTFSIVAISLNLLLLWLTNYKVTSDMKLYRRLLQMSCVADLGLAVIDFICQPALIIDSGVVLYISNGFVGAINRELSCWLIVMHNIFVYITLIMIPIQFLYRLRVISITSSQSNNSKFNFSSLIFIAAIFMITVTFLINVYALFYATKQFSQGQDVTSLLLRKGWTFVPFAFGAYFLNPGILSIIVNYLGTFVVSYTLIIWCERKIMRLLKDARRKSGASTNGAAPRIHKDVHKALISFAICPLISTAIPFFFFSGSLITGVSLSGQTSAFLTIFFTSSALLNPLFTIYFVRPYRNEVFQFFIKRRQTFHRLSVNRIMWISPRVAQIPKIIQSSTTDVAVNRIV